MFKAALFVFVLAATGASLAAEKITVVIGAKAPDLERFAADEFSAQSKTLFGVTPSIQDHLPADDSAVVLIGSPATNAALSALTAGSWPKLTDQGHILKTAKIEGREVLILGGGSPQATLLAVYEHGYQHGMRYLLNGDVPPIEKPKFRLSGFDAVLEPAVSVRAWSAFTGNALGAESWSLAEQQFLLGQLAKNKFTHYVLPAEFQRVEPLQVDGDTAGRTAFKGAKVFGGASHPGLRDGIQARATALGMKTVAPEGISPLPLGAPNASVLPQFALRHLASSYQKIGQDKRAGFVAQVVMPGDLNAPVHFLSRATFGGELDADRALDALVRPICGEGVAERLQMGFDQVEQAAKLIAANDTSVAVPGAEILMRHLASGEPPPAWWNDAKTCYTQAMNEM